MKLSNIVDYLNHLNKEAQQPDFVDAKHRFESILHSVAEHPLQVGSLSNDLETDLHNINQAVAQFDTTLSVLKAELLKMISEQEPEYYAQSRRLYEDEMCYETNEYILDRKLSIGDQNRIELEFRIKRYTDWRLPGLLFRPGKESFIEDMVPMDPLYLVDQNENLLAPAMTKFSAEYQRRLRPYTIDDRADGELMTLLPNKQFGFVFAYNYFNYNPLGVICRYLDVLYEKLRPGGRIIFTYNECEHASGVMLAEKSFMCYTPGSRIRSYAESIGFEFEYQNTLEANAAWFEFKRPGDIVSLRGGQNMAKIMPKQL